MTPTHSRKSFFGKIAGLIAAVGLTPRLLARTPEAPAQNSAVSSPTPFTLRPDTRAVARREETV
ncbi:MAG TPA: hypothetical protein VGD88_05765 [Opitutaceae bacterium]